MEASDEISAVDSEPTFARIDQIKQEPTKEWNATLVENSMNQSRAQPEEIEGSAVDSEPTFVRKIRVAKKGEPIALEI